MVWGYCYSKTKESRLGLSTKLFCDYIGDCEAIDNENGVDCDSYRSWSMIILSIMDDKARVKFNGSIQFYIILNFTLFCCLYSILNKSICKILK